MSNDLISWLQRWYTAQCDGGWEHHYGITIGTLDNPGWYSELRAMPSITVQERLRFLNVLALY
jgi:hypothetical protein